MIHKIIYEPIFQTETLFYVCVDPDTVIAHARSKYDIQLKKEDFEGASGICWKLYSKITARSQKSHCWFVWLEIPGDLRLTTHEAGHLAFNMLNHHEVKCDIDNQEVYCYFLEFFTYELWTAMELPKEKKKR